MSPERFHAITSRYRRLRLALLGDFCLDRYLEIDPERREVSLETGRPVHNVVNVRAQPGGAGTILNNFCALGVGVVYPLGFCGTDGEGFELWSALEKLPGVRLEHFIRTPQRRTFTYCKPLVLGSNGAPPTELNRLDSKNWTPAPPELQHAICEGLSQAAGAVDAVMVLEQVDLPNTGVITEKVLSFLGQLIQERPELLFIADSRRGLRGYPGMVFKMNAAELAASLGARAELDLEQIQRAASELARRNQRSVFVTLADRGLVGASAAGEIAHVPALPLRGPIDVVGAGDAVSANLTAALASGAALTEAVELANAAASIVIHKLGTTGTASIPEICERLGFGRTERPR